MPEIEIGRMDSFAHGDRRLISDGKMEIGVFRIKDTFYAFANRCPHQGGPICQGKVMPKVVETLQPSGESMGLHFSEDAFHLVCPWHGYEFRFETGAHPGSSRYKLKAFETLLKDGMVYVVV